MGDNEVEHYLEHLVLKQNVASRTQTSVLNSLSFLYKHIINKGADQLLHNT
ncbi:phage integrase N-terminal SAM-like domain-containing protein [Pseudoalteromonas ostreae]|uniref:phage integrase N-terminal SAM-like domain-containing protein n=1 Tax=Pseudoalteromonas ostreae TaxID=2774154 RepID=UPI001B387828